MLREALPVGSGSVPKSYWNRGVEAQTLFSLLTYAWLWCATRLSWRPRRDVQALLIKLVRCDKFTELAAPKTTTRMGLFAILQVSKDVRNFDHVVIRSSQRFNGTIMWMITSMTTSLSLRFQAELEEFEHWATRMWTTKLVLHATHCMTLAP